MSEPSYFAAATALRKISDAELYPHAKAALRKHKKMTLFQGALDAKAKQKVLLNLVAALHQGKDQTYLWLEKL